MAVDPNPAVTLAGSGVLLHVMNPSGEPIPVQGNADGAIDTSGGGGGGGTVDQGTAAAVAGSWSVRVANAGASAFITPFVSGDAVAQSGTWNITNISGTISLPTGAATSALQGAGLPVALGAGGGVKIDGSGTALPVSGTVAATQSGVWNVTDVSGTVSLPTGAATSALQGAGLPGALTGGGGVKVGLVDAIPAGANSIGTVVSTNAAASQADGHSASIGSTADADTDLTLIGRIKNLLSRIPAALVGGRLDTNIGAWLGSTTPTVGQKTAAASIPVVLPSDSFISPVTQVPSASGWTIPATAIPYVGALLHIRSGSSLYPLSGQTDGTLSIQGVNAVGNTNISRPIPAGFVDDATGANIVPKADTTGRPRVMLGGAAPHANATLDVYTQLSPTAFTSGICVVKATAGRCRSVHVIYTGGTASGLFLQLHNAATATTPTDATIRWVVKIDTTNLIVDRDFEIDIPMSAGIKLAFSSTASTYTAATSETGIVIAHYA